MTATGHALALPVLVGRYDRTAFEPEGSGARVRLAAAGGDAWDALLERGAARLERAGGDADATLTADSQTWAAIAHDVDGGMRAFRSGRLAVRRNVYVQRRVPGSDERSQRAGALALSNSWHASRASVHAGGGRRPARSRHPWAGRHQGIVPVHGRSGG
jgi:hypothetical protein